MSEIKETLDKLQRQTIEAIQSSPEAQPGEWQRWSYVATFLLQILELVIHKHAPQALMADETIVDTSTEPGIASAPDEDEAEPEEEHHTGRRGRRR
jgi:hypothetical protein